MTEGRREPNVILSTADNPARAVSTVTQDKEMASTLSPRDPPGLTEAEAEDKVNIALNLQPAPERRAVSREPQACGKITG